MPPLPQISHALAERHEALWLRLSSLHKDICAIAAKKPEAAVGDFERATVEGLISDCRPYLRKPVERLPVAAQNFAGLAVQLGQVLAVLDDYENRHAYWDGQRNCRVWRVSGDPLPIARLRQAGLVPQAEAQGDSPMRETFMRLMKNRERFLYQEGFRKGQAARLGPPDPTHLEPDWLDQQEKTYPRPSPQR